MDASTTTTDGALPAMDGAWLPVADAAKVAGISQRSIRRRVQEGTAHARLVGRLTHVYVRRDGRTDVLLPSMVASVPTMDAPASAVDVTLPAAGGNTPTVDGSLAQLLREQIEGRLRAEQAAAMWQERARNLEAQVNDLLALPAYTPPQEQDHHWWQWWKQKEPS